VRYLLDEMPLRLEHACLLAAFPLTSLSSGVPVETTVVTIAAAPSPSLAWIVSLRAPEQQGTTASVS